MRYIMFNLFVAFIFIGCTMPPKPFDKDSANSQSVNKHLVCAKQIDIQPVRINGSNPPSESFDYFLKKIKKYTTNNIVVHKVLDLNIQKGKIDAFIQAFGDEHRIINLSDKDRKKFTKVVKELTDTESSVMMIYTPELILHSDLKRNLRGLAFPADMVHNVVAYNAVNINNAPVISDIQAWKIVLTHEVGHRLGVPSDKSHNEKFHCTHRECVMYARPDWQTVVSVISSGMPYDFCDKCKAELREAKKECN